MYNTNIAQIKHTENFDEYGGRPINFRQTLWHVNDAASMNFPEDRFTTDISPMVESIIENGNGPMEEADIPEGLLSFVKMMTDMFQAIPTELSSAKDVVAMIKSFCDYTEPYFLFIDMPVQLCSNQLVHTYRHKKSGSVLDPTKVEIFQVNSRWEFKPFENAMTFLEHPMVKEVLAGRNVQNPETGAWVTKDDLLDRLIALVWGPAKHINVHIEDWLFRHYEDQEGKLSRKADDNLLLSIDTFKRHDYFFWRVVTVATFMWIRSRHALPYLISVHPIYGSLLQLNSVTKAVELRTEAQGEAIVYNWDVYTREHLTVEEARRPGTCECCQSTLHCTKFVNATALFHPVCSCGHLVDVEATGEHRYEHSFSSACTPYRNAHPDFEAFVCQRCLQMALKDPHNHARKCDRFSCPATNCSHHAGQDAYRQALAQRRRMMLTYMSH